MSNDLGLTLQAAVLTAAFSSSVPAAPQTALPATPPAAPTAPTVAPLVEPHSHASITETEAAQIARDIREDVAKGRISPEEAAKRFDDLGATPEQRAPDTRSDEVKQLDEHFPPARPQDFIIPYYPPGQAPPVMPKELQQCDQSARTWLARAEFDRTLGNSLITTISRVAQHTKAMTPDQLDTYGENEYVKRQATYKDMLEDKFRQAGRMVEELEKKQPGLKNLLKSKGIGDNALVASLLIGQSDRWHARRKGP